MAIQTLLPYDINQKNDARNTASSISQTLEGLVNHHLTQMQTKKQREVNARGYQEGYRLSPEQANFIASQSPEFQKDIVKALNDQQQAQAFRNAINPTGAQNQSGMQELQTGLQSPGTAGLEQSLGALGGQQGSMGTPSGQPQQNNVSDILSNRALNPNLQAKAEELNLKKEANLGKRYEYNKETINKTREAATRAKDDNHVLESLIKANESGKLFQGPTRKLLEQLGLEDVVTNTPTQFAAKQLERFITGAPSKFGTSRFTNFLAESYQKGLPRLVNTKEAFDLIAKNIILENKAVEAQYKSMRDIIKESEVSGKPIPYDLADQALERAQPQLDIYAQQSLKNLESAIGDKKGSFDSLPSAKDYSGKTITDTKTGARFKSNGAKWVKV